MPSYKFKLPLTEKKSEILRTLNHSREHPRQQNQKADKMQRTPRGYLGGSLQEIYEKDSYSKLNQPALYSESFSSTVADCCVEERYT